MGSLSEGYRMFGIRPNTTTAADDATTLALHMFTTPSGGILQTNDVSNYAPGIMSFPSANFGGYTRCHACDLCGQHDDNVLSFTKSEKSITVCIECMIFLISKLGDIFKSELLEHRKPVPTTMPDELFELAK